MDISRGSYSSDRAVDAHVHSGYRKHEKNDRLQEFVPDVYSKIDMNTRRVMTISFDFIGEAIHDRVLMEDKIKRNPDWTDVSILAMAWSKKREIIELSSHITVESFPTLLGGYRPLYDLLSIVVVPFVALRRQERPDVVFVSEFPLVWAAAITRFFVGGRVDLRLITLPTEYAEHWGGWTHRLYYRLHELLTWRMVDQYFVINDTTQKYLLNLGVPANRIEMQAPDTIARDEKYIKQARKGLIREKFNIPTYIPIILSIGRLVDDKGYAELLDIFAASQVEGRLIIVGDGILHDALINQVRTLNIEHKVIFAGWQDRKEVWNYFADADVFVLISKAESLGMVFWEAMYMNVPVIGRPIGGIPESTGKDGERGFLWNTADGAEAFKDRLERAIRKDESVVAMIKRARAFVELKIRPVIQSRL